MSKEIEPQGIIFQLEWKKKTGHTSRDEVASIGIWDTMDNSLDWTTFRSYLCQNLGTMEDISVAYVDSEGDELPIESECEFQEALKYARHRARKGREIILKLDSQGVPLPQGCGKASSKVREVKQKHAHKLALKPGAKSSSAEKIRSSAVQASLMRPTVLMHRFPTSATAEEKKLKVKKHCAVEDEDMGKLKKVVMEELTGRQELLVRRLRAEWDESPPQWFKKYMQKVKSEIIAEVTTNVVFANRQVVELVERRMQDCGATQTVTKKSRKKKKNGSDEDSDCPQESDLGSSKLLKKLEKLHKQEKKLDSKLEKLETKTKRRMEKKSLQQPLERKVSSSILSASSSRKKSGGNVGPYLMDAIVLYDGQQVSDTRAFVGAAFTKVWEIMNNGTLPWTDKTELRLTWGTPGLEPEETAICCPILNPGEKGHISINFKPPDVAGTFETYWHFYHMGKRFGHWLCCAVVVDSRDANEQDRKNNDERMEVNGLEASPDAAEEGVEEPDATPNVQEEGEYAAVYDDNSDSLTFMSDVSTDVASEDDENFVVVPMPACFQCEVPLDTAAEESEAPQSIQNNKSDADNNNSQGSSDNDTHQTSVENDMLDKNISKINEIVHNEFEKVMKVLGDLSLATATCSSVENGKEPTDKSDAVKTGTVDEPVLPAKKESSNAVHSKKQTPSSGKGDGVYVVDGSGRCTLLKKDSKTPDDPSSVFVFGNNSRFQKKTGDKLLQSGKSTSGNNKVYVVNKDGSCSLLDGNNASAAQPAVVGDQAPAPKAPKVASKSHKAPPKHSLDSSHQYVQGGNDCSEFVSVNAIGGAVGTHVPKSSTGAKVANEARKSVTKNSRSLPSSAAAANGPAAMYARRYVNTGTFPGYAVSGHSMNTGLGGMYSMGTGFAGSCGTIASSLDPATLFSTAGMTGAGFTTTNNMTENVHVGNAGIGYSPNCQPARTFSSAEVGVAPAANGGGCFPVPDAGVSFTPIGNNEASLTIPGIATVTYTTTGNATTSGVNTPSIASQRPIILPMANGDSYIIESKVVALPPGTKTISISPDASDAKHVMGPNYYEPLIFDDNFFTQPQAVRFEMIPPNPDFNFTPVVNPETYFEPACCGPNPQSAANVDAGITTNTGKQTRATFDPTNGNQGHFVPNAFGRRSAPSHAAAFPPPPPPPPPPPTFGYVPTYYPYSVVPPTTMPMGSGAQTVDATPIQQVPARLFPQGLLPSTFSTASSVLNSVSGMLRNLYPRMDRQNCAANVLSSSTTTTNLMHLQEMGFIDQERNMALLHVYDNDINQVVTKLLAEREMGENGERPQATAEEPM